MGHGSMDAFRRFSPNFPVEVYVLPGTLDLMASLNRNFRVISGRAHVKSHRTLTKWHASSSNFLWLVIDYAIVYYLFYRLFDGTISDFDLTSVIFL